MRSMSRASLVVFAAVLMTSGSVRAHHGSDASYNMTTPTELTGVITEFVWANPHVRLFVDVTDAQGQVGSWGIELRPAPAGLSRAGWTRHTVQPGDTITITVFPSKFGTLTGLGETGYPITLNGERLPGTGERRR